LIEAFLRWAVPARFRPKGYLTHLVRERTNDTVRLGPFTGMRYVENSIGSAHLPKLLGTYESELAAVIETVCARKPILIVNIGAAEGYYAVGLALRNPQARVVALEREPEGREALNTMARRNRVQQRLEIRGECGPTDLEQTLQTAVPASDQVANQKPFVLCDIEGQEERLLDLNAVPNLRRTLMLVETHDFIHPGITERIRKRFSPSHRVACIWQTARSIKDFPFRSAATHVLPTSYLSWAVSEWRPARMCWLWMQPLE
jgi:hypothetical protein